MDETPTPTFERILSEFESAPAGKPFEPATVAVLAQLQRAAREHYAKLLDTLLAAEATEELGLPRIRGAQVLHRRIANALAQAVLRQIPRPQRLEDQVRIAELALGSLRARADEVKWHAFEQTTMPRASWRQTYELVRAIESIGMDRRPLSGGATCTDAFGHCVLLASLNVGILSAAQMELAHRWLSASAQDMRVEPYFDSDAHWYQLDLAYENGPRRVTSASEASGTTRFFAVSSLGDKLAQARTRLYAGHVAVGAVPSPKVALDFGAFLDLAERLWSPDWRRTSLRAEREKADGAKIEVILGIEDVLRALRGEPVAALSRPSETWTLRDRSRSGLGVLVKMSSAAQLPLGAVVAFRAAAAEPWELGCIARRIRAAEEELWSVGVRRLSANPVAIALTPCSQGTQAASSSQSAPVEAIYAPIASERGRVDGIVLPAGKIAATNEFLLTTQGGIFRIRVNRVIDRGEHWMRVGFEVLGKHSGNAPRAATA